MSPETLTPQEPKLASGPVFAEPRPLAADEINKVSAQRATMLAALETFISRKLYFALEEKLQNERQKLEELFGFEQGQQTRRSKYTNVLDTQYFEQIFLLS